MKTLKFLQLILLIILTSGLSAQVPDLLDPYFDLNQHALTPKQVKEHHVKSCTENSSMFGTDQIYYDGNGRVIKNKDNKTFFIYNGFDNILTGHVFEVKSYADFYHYAGAYNIQYDSIGRLYRIEYIYKSGFVFEDSEYDFADEDQIVTQFEYKDGKLFATQEIGHSEGISSKDFNNITFFEYEEDGSLKQVYEVRENDYDKVTLSYQYSDNRLVLKEDAMYVKKYIYDPNGKLTGIEKVTKVMYESFGEASAFEPSRTYEYNEYGLVSKITDPDWESTTEFDYEYISPVIISVKADGLEYISIYNFSQQYGYEQYLLTNGEAKFAVYPPHKELYILEVTPEFKLPVILTPGKELAITISPDNIYFEDEENTIMFAIEMEKLQAIEQGQTEEQTLTDIASIIVENMKEYPEFMGFLFYTELWDIQNNKQLFLDYTEKMLELYPLNFKASEAYVMLRQN